MQITLDCTHQNVEAICTIAAILNDQCADPDAVERAISLLMGKITKEKVSVASRKTPVLSVFPIRVANALMRNSIEFVEQIDVSILHTYGGIGDGSISLIKNFIEKGDVEENTEFPESAGRWVSLSDRYTKEQIAHFDQKIFEGHLVWQDGKPYINLNRATAEIIDYLVLATQTRKQPERMQAFMKAIYLERLSAAKAAELIGVSANHARTKRVRFERQVNIYARRLAENLTKRIVQ